MLDKLITAIEPFALTLVVIAGASLAGWVDFSNQYTVGVLVVFFGILLVLRYVYRQIKSN